MSHIRFTRFLLYIYCVCTALISQPLSAQVVAMKQHIVQKGETLYRISQNYGVSVEQISNANGGLSASELKIGKTILIPQNGAPVAVQQKQPTIKGYHIEYKDYKVKRKDTAYSLAKANDITIDELIQANPQLEKDNYKIKKGMTLRIPVKVKDAAPKFQGLTTIRVAVILPFTGGNIENERSIEFYRGLLMGIEVLKENGTNITIEALNEPAPDNGAAVIVQNALKNNPDVIIGPLYPSHFGDFAAVASQSTKVVVPFSSKVQQVAYRKNLFVVNTPTSYEPTLSADLFTSTFKKTTCIVFLHGLNGNRTTFTHELQNKVSALGYDIVSQTAHPTLDILKTALKRKANHQVIFVPDTDDEATLSELLPLLMSLKTAMPNMGISLLGYENWLPLAAGKYKEQMHALNSYILASTYFYPYTTAAMNFTADYKKWFNTELLNCTPRMAPLGYDLALSVLGGLATYGTDYGTQSPQAGSIAAQPKLQSDLRFIKASATGGYVSRSMWLVNFKPDMSIVKLSAK